MSALPPLPFCDVGVLLPYVRSLHTGIHTQHGDGTRWAGWGCFCFILLFSAYFIHCRPVKSRKKGRKRFWRKEPGTGEGIMREIEIKVSPIRTGEQAREMEEDKQKRILGRSVPHSTNPRGRSPNQASSCKDSLERRGEKRRKKEKKAKRVTRAPICKVR